MAKDKERSVNPAQAQRKAEKARALKKSKTELQAKRNEKLAQRNPARIQKQIDDLKALEAAGDIKAREKAILADLERDLKAVNRARESLGDKAPQLKSYSKPITDDNKSVLGKRTRDGGPRPYHRHNSGSDTDESVRNIPWPKDTPPPIPAEFRRNNTRNQDGNTASISDGKPHPLPAKPVQAQTVYASEPQLRDLKKEVTTRFVPTVVRQKQKAVTGQSGQLLEPEEYDKLEAAGYLKAGNAQKAEEATGLAGDAELARLKAEEEAFEKELAMQELLPEQEMPSNHSVSRPRQVEIEEVEDEDL